MSAAKFRVGRARSLLSAARGNMLTIMAVASFLFSAVLAATYELELLDQCAILQPSAIQTQHGNAYLVPLNGIAGRAFLSGLIYPEDSTAWPNSSTLEFIENGRRLGPGHSFHSEIATLGSGRYSHWQGYLVFSSSDNTDPRSNGRVYSIRQPPSAFLVLLFTAAGILISLASIRKSLKTGGMAPVRGFLEMVLPKESVRVRIADTIHGHNFSVILSLIGVEAYFLWKFGLIPIENMDGSYYAHFADQLSFAIGMTTIPAQDWQDDLTAISGCLDTL